MKKKTWQLTKILVMTLVMAFFVGSIAVNAADAAKPTINKDKATINVGDTDKLELEITGLGADDRKPIWISWNENIAAVEQDGDKCIVTALRKGKTVISSGTGQMCLVTVVEPSIKLDKSAATIYKGDEANSTTVELKATTKGASADVKWSSSVDKVAQVDEKGKVTPVSAGIATITATANGREASCKITVVENDISLNLTEMKLSTKGAGSSMKLVPTVVGSNKKVTWKSEPADVATVSGGKVTGKSDGEAIITATANGKSATCKVTVKKELISIDEEAVELYVTGTNGEAKQFKTNAAKQDVLKWTSSAPDVAEVDEKTGKVTAKKAGTAVITVKKDDSKDDDSKDFDTCRVVVTDSAVAIKEDTVNLKTKGASKTYMLNFGVIGRKNNVKWTSSNTKAVAVSKGKLTAKKVGSAVITAEANGIKDTVTVYVQEFSPAIALNQSEYTLYTKGKETAVSLKAVVDGADKKVAWNSDNKGVAEVKNGKVTAKGEGRALITATANGVTAKCWILVKETGVALEEEYITLKKTETKQIIADITGASQSVTYKSSDSKVATVTKTGAITAKADGTAEIEVKANGEPKTCHVTVTDCEHVWELMPPALTGIPKKCTERSAQTYECSKCKGRKQEVTRPTAHKFGRWIVTTRPTETSAGVEKQVCSVCKEENVRSIPAKNKVESADAYKLVWEDDFNGDKLNLEDWNFEYHEAGWVNAELQKYVDDANNTYVKDGNLYIQARKEGTGENAVYTSGRINTQGKHDFKYGRFEVKAKVPSGKGFLPAFWMMPTDESYYGQWPKCGEIDIMEVHGSALDKSYGTLHFGEPHTQKQGSYTLPEGAKNFNEEFHVFACEWDPGEFRFYVDDKLFYTVNDWFTKRSGFGEAAYPAPYDQNFYMILNLAVGGSWVGYPDADTEFGDNAQFVIDYVKVYQKEEYDMDVDKPENEVILRDPDETGNYIINGDFAKAEDLKDEKSNWQLLTAGGGEAAAEISDKALHITSTKAGDVNYGVQIVQANLPMEKGVQYKLTYDAYADEARTMITDVSAPDRGYIRYLADTTVNLTTEKKPFEHIFEMKDDSDANGRVEFNLGNQGSTAKVHISNVRLVKEGAVKEEEKGILPDGNFVYNGKFDEGNEPGRYRLAYWDWNIKKCPGASVSVTADSRRELKVTVPDSVKTLEDVVVSQDGMAIPKGKKLVLSFDAYADKAKKIKSVIGDFTFESELTAERKEFKYEFTIPADADTDELSFLLGVPGTVYIDNVCIREDSMIVNGDFTSGMTGYEVYVNDGAKVPNYIVDSLNEKNAFAIDIADTGAEAWYIQLKQNGIKLEKDKWYKLAFDAKSTVDREIMYALQRDGTSDNDWTPYSGEPKAALTKDYQNFSKVFKMKYDTDLKTVLSISMAAVGGKQISEKHTIVIDNITLEETEAQPEPEGPPVGTNMLTNLGTYVHVKANGGTAEADVTSENGVYKFDIKNPGDADWNVQLNQKGLTLQKDAKYQFKMKIKSDVARKVTYVFQEDQTWKRYGGEDLDLAAGEEKSIDYTLDVSTGEQNETRDSIVFQVSLGKVGDSTPASTIEISEVSLVKTSGGSDTPVDPTPVDPTPEEPVAVGTELIKNGDFAKGEESWEKFAGEGGEADISFADGKAVYNISNVGTKDYSVQLKQSGLKLEKGATYKVNLKIKSTAKRDVKVSLLDPENKYAWYGGIDISLNADRQKTISRIVQVGDDKATSSTIAFQISMGVLGDNTPASTIEIDDISITKVASDAAADEEKEDPAPAPDPDKPTPDPDKPTPNPDDPAPVTPPTEVEGNLIKNGIFAENGKDWNCTIDGKNDKIDGDQASATNSFAGNKATFVITNVGNDEWCVNLNQENLTLTKGAKYQFKMKIKSTETRRVKYVFQKPVDPWTWYEGEAFELTKDQEKQVDYTFTVDEKKDTASDIKLQISLGRAKDAADKDFVDTAPSTIEISEVSLVKIPGGGTTPETPPTPTEPTPTTPTDVEGNLIKNGIFAEDGKGWNYSLDGKNGNDASKAAEATKGFANNKAKFVITKVGNDEWCVNLNQTGLTLEQGAKYQFKMKIKSTEARKVKYVFQRHDTTPEDKYVQYVDQGVELSKDQLESVNYEFTVSESTCDSITFQISMGQMKDWSTGSPTDIETAPSTIEISEISLVKTADAPAQETPAPQEEATSAKRDDAKQEKSVSEESEDVKAEAKEDAETKEELETKNEESDISEEA